MARMYPGMLDAETVSSAERKLYETFADQLSDEWTVFHALAEL